MLPTTNVLPEAVHRLTEEFSTDRAQAALRELCSDAFAGRRIGSPGHDLAQAWLLEQMTELKLRTEVFSFTAEASVLALTALPQFEVVSPDGTRQNLEYRREFQEHPQSAFQQTVVEGVAYRESSNTRLNKGWLILDTVPTAAVVEQWVQRGVVGLLLPQHVGPQGYLPKRMIARATLPLPIISVREDILAQLEGKTIQASMPLQTSTAKGGHVLGQLDGTAPELASAPLLVGAHFDGVGDDISGYRLPGAADNAAGVAVILELARVISSGDMKPRRPIIFAAFDGEEINALGSQAYAQALNAEEKTPVVINLDGAAKFHEAVWAELSDNADVLIEALDVAGEWLEIPLTVGAVGSDNRRYAQVGFPTVGVALGGIGGHTPADTVDQVDPPAMSIAGRLLLAAIWQLAF